MRFQEYLLFAMLFGAQAALGQTTADLFDPSVVHEVRMTMDPANWQKLKDNIFDSTDYDVDSFQWHGATATASVNNFQIHSRGHGSRYALKPGLHVGFDKKVKGQTFLGLSTLELKPNTQDASMLHERITMLMFNRMGIPASREVHSRFYMNGEYIGVYLIVEFVNTDFLTRIFNENNGYLYQYVPGDWSGGPGAGYHFEFLGDDLNKYSLPSSDPTPVPFSPNTHSNAPDTVTLHDMIQTINQASDAAFVSAMAPYLDLRLWLTHVAVETYVADFDCILGDVFGMNNFHLYRFVNKKLSQFIPWDKDNAFDYNERPILQNADQNMLMRRLMAIPAYRSVYFEALLKCGILAGGAGGWMEQETVREYNMIRDAAYQDTNKSFLDAGVLRPATNDQFDAAFAYVKGFAAHRTPFVANSVLNQGYQLPSGYPSVSDGGVVSAAANAPAAAGGLASVYGANFGTADTTSIYFNGYAAPVLFASPGQVNVQAPWESTGSASVGAIVSGMTNSTMTANPATYGAMVNGVPSNVVTANVNTYAPAIFVTVHHADGSLITSGNPATANEVLDVYATGLGPVGGSMVTGQKASLTSLQGTTQNASATIGGASATVLFSGLAPGFIGLYQVNVQLPATVPSGAQTPLVISIGGQTSPPSATPTK